MIKSHNSLSELNFKVASVAALENHPDVHKNFEEKNSHLASFVHATFSPHNLQFKP